MIGDEIIFGRIRSECNLPLHPGPGVGMRSPCRDSLQAFCLHRLYVSIPYQSTLLTPSQTKRIRTPQTDLPGTPPRSTSTSAPSHLPKTLLPIKPPQPLSISSQLMPRTHPMLTSHPRLSSPALRLSAGHLAQEMQPQDRQTHLRKGEGQRRRRRKWDAPKGRKVNLGRQGICRAPNRCSCPVMLTRYLRHPTSP
jgi:hypothetical protein